MQKVFQVDISFVSVNQCSVPESLLMQEEGSVHSSLHQRKLLVQVLCFVCCWFSYHVVCYCLPCLVYLFILFVCLLVVGICCCLLCGGWI
jgi:hypothetical protein